LDLETRGANIAHVFTRIKLNKSMTPYTPLSIAIYNAILYSLDEGFLQN
jgi:hypothetical protein